MGNLKTDGSMASLPLTASVLSIFKLWVSMSRLHGDRESGGLRPRCHIVVVQGLEGRKD